MQSHVRATRPTRAVVRASLLAAGAAATLAIGACSDATGAEGARRPTSVSFQTASSGAVSSTSSMDIAAAQVPVTSGGHTIDVTSAEVVLSRVMLKPAEDGQFSETDSDSESDSDARGSAIKMGAATVALPLDSGVITPFTGLIPQGTYDRLRLDAEFLRVKGTYDSQPFDVTLPVNLHLQLRLNPPLNITGATDSTNVTVRINVPQWFVHNGVVVDPRTLQSNRDLLNQLRNNIRASFRAYKDSDRDGDDADSDSDSR